MKANNWLTGLIVLAVGVLLIVWHQRIDVLNWMVIVVGLMLIVPGLYSLISALVRKGEDRSRRGSHSAPTSTVIASVGALALGLWMIVDPAFFVGLLAYIFGAILILVGIYHIIYLSVWSRPFVLPFWYYVIPVLMIAAGVVVLCTSVRTMNSVVVLITGIAFVCSGVTTFLEIAATHGARVEHTPGSPTAPAEVSQTAVADTPTFSAHDTPTATDTEDKQQTQA